MSKRRISFKYSPKANHVIPGWEDLDDEGYTYRFWIEWKDRPGCVFICESGVHIEWDDTNDWMDTNIIPKKLFGELDRLKPKHVRKILKLLIDNDFDGHTIPAEKVDGLYQLWKDLGCP